MTLVLPVAVAIAALAVAVFAWAVRSGQFDDLVTPALRVLLDDEPEPGPEAGPVPVRAAEGGREEGRDAREDAAARLSTPPRSPGP